MYFGDILATMCKTGAADANKIEFCKILRAEFRTFMSGIEKASVWNHDSSQAELHERFTVESQ